MEAIPLAAEDRAILALESDTVAGHTCKVIVLGPGAPEPAALRAAIAERIPSEPLLTMKLGAAEGEPAWVPAEGFAVEDHVLAPGGAALDPAGLRLAVAEIFAERLDRDLPLWRIDALPLERGGSALVWRIHHALADGTAAMRFAHEVLWDEAPEAEGKAPKRPARHEDDARRRGHLAGFLEREFAGSRAGSPFDGEIGTRRAVAFASTPLRALHDAAKALDGATLNDAVLSLVAGSLRHWLEAEHSPLGDVRVRVPVSLHHEGDDASNRDSFFSLSLPLNEPDPVDRLRAVHAATSERKQHHDAEEMDRLLHGLGRVSHPLARLADRIEASPRRFALSVSNVPGPRSAVSVLGSAVESVHSLAEIGARHALRVAVVSIGDELHFGFCADPAIVDDLAQMAAGVEREAAALEEAAG
jgi:hypothetical protein